MQSALWIIPILPFILAFFTTWSFREAIAETVWFNIAYVTALGIIFAMDMVGVGMFSTSPTGSGGAVALGVGFIALAVRRHQWKQEQRRIAEMKAAERARQARAAANGRGRRKQEKSLIVDAFRLAGEVNKARKKAKR